MTRVPPMPSPAPPPPGSEKPRLVCDYGGLQILDARDEIQVRITQSPPPRGLRWGLKDAGFKSTNGMLWTRPHTPDAIMKAQTVGNIFFAKETE